MGRESDLESPIFVSRLLTEEGGEKEPAPLSAHFDAAAIVVLGDPGAGKTELFKRAAEEEGARSLTVREFLWPQLEVSQEQTLYLDALDEVRSRTEDGHSVLDQVIGKLLKLGRPKLRLSCRATDWYGGLDESHLSKATADGKVRVLRLLPLSHEDVRTIVAGHGLDPEAFLQQAYEHGILDWLTNPQDLGLLLEALDDGQWPESRQELFDRACRSLAREPNLEHSRLRLGRLRERDVLKAAGYLCAIHLAAGTAGFALEQNLADADFPYIREIDASEISPEAVEAAVRRRLFRNQGPERVTPMHRTIAEYLAAGFLVERVKGGLPLNRVLAMNP